MMKLTVKVLEALTHDHAGRMLPDGGSLKGKVYALREGHVSVHFVFAYRFNGAAKTVRCGSWPETSLSEIRKARDAYRALLHSGVCPAAHNKAEREKNEATREADRLRAIADSQEKLNLQHQRLEELALKQARLSVNDLFRLWQQHELRNRSDKGTEALRSFEADVFPLLGQIAAADVTKAHIQQVLDRIVDRRTERNTMTRTMKKTLADLRQMFGFALDRDLIESDPTARIKKAKLGTDGERDRVLSESEVVALFRQLPDSGLPETSKHALLLQLATLARIGEVLCARWEHVDFNAGTWTFPDTKNGLKHTIYLGDFATHELRQLFSLTGETPWLFPPSRRAPGVADVQHVCVKTVSKQVADRQRVDGAALPGRTQKTIALVLNGGNWRPHDLRRTGATNMAELGVLPDVVERCLNHVEEQKMKRIYQRVRYEGPMRDAWRLWGERLEILRDIALGVSNVVMLKAA